MTRIFSQIGVGFAPVPAANNSGDQFGGRTLDSRITTTNKFSYWSRDLRFSAAFPNPQQLDLPAKALLIQRITLSEQHPAYSWDGNDGVFELFFDDNTNPIQFDARAKSLDTTSLPFVNFTPQFWLNGFAFSRLIIKEIGPDIDCLIRVIGFAEPIGTTGIRNTGNSEFGMVPTSVGNNGGGGNDNGGNAPPTNTQGIGGSFAES